MLTRVVFFLLLQHLLFDGPFESMQKNVLSNKSSGYCPSVCLFGPDTTFSLLSKNYIIDWFYFAKKK